MNKGEPARISLGYRPRGCRNVRIIGVRPNLEDYGAEEAELLAKADTVLYPTPLYAQPLTDAGKKVFPRPSHYYYLSDKIRQTMLFKLLHVPTPITRVYYGQQARNVKDQFKYPFVAKIPRGLGQGKGVFLINSDQEWQDYLKLTHIAYVQDFLGIKKDLRVVAVAGRLLAAYWRHVSQGEFRANLKQGGRVDFTGVPDEGVNFALEVSRRCGFDDVGLDICFYKGSWLVLEANMHYGQKGLAQGGLSLAAFLDELVEDGAI